MADSGRRSSRARRVRWRRIVSRGGPFVVVYLAALVGFMMGVGVSERDLTLATTATKAYYALGLFVVGGMDIGTPVGGPAIARALLWLSYFLAPLLTATAILEAALRMLAPLALRYRLLDAQVVIAGCGNLALLYLRRLRDLEPGARVVVVERDPVHARISEFRDLHGAGVVPGDITSDAILARLGLHRVKRALLLTGNDFTNLDAAAKILRMAPNLRNRLVVHVSDLGFMKSVADTSVVRDCETFNGHEFAAFHLVKDNLLSRFRSTTYPDLVVLAGFGRFGQTVLHQLQEHALGSFGKVVIVDFIATKSARLFAEQPGFAPGYETEIIDGDLRDPLVWAQVSDIIEADRGDPVVVVGSGEDGTNLHVALDVSKQCPNAYIIARSFRESPFAADVSLDAGVHPFNIAELISVGMPDHWFSTS